MFINGREWTVIRHYPKFILCTNGIWRECFLKWDLKENKTKLRKPIHPRFMQGGKLKEGIEE